jgi:hypothetical protein
MNNRHRGQSWSMLPCLRRVLLSVAIGAFLFAPATATRAATQPDEHSHEAACQGALDANDRANVIAYCTLAAEDHAADSYFEAGEQKGIEILFEATYLQFVAQARTLTCEFETSNILYENARHLLTHDAMPLLPPDWRTRVVAKVHDLDQGFSQNRMLAARPCRLQ